MRKKERQAEIDRLLKEVNAERTKLGKLSIGIYQESGMYTPHQIKESGTFGRGVNVLNSVKELIAYLKGMIVSLKNY